MALTLEQYAAYLDTRDLPWPAAPEVDRPKAKPHLVRLPEVRAVLWNVYGTLLAIAGGELLFEHPTPFVMNNALDKTIQEFKMWASMSRKPGQPSDYMGQIYRQLLADQRVGPGGGERHPEVAAERLWEAILKRLLQKDYKFDAGFFGSLNEYSRKVAYFFHASLQGTACYPGAADALRHVASAGLTQGLLADGQCFTTVQLQRGLAAQDADLRLDDVIDPGLRVLSYEVRGRKPSERLFRQALHRPERKGHRPGRGAARRLAPDGRTSCRPAASACAPPCSPATGPRCRPTPEQLKDPAVRPDVLLTEPAQIAEVVA